MLQLPCYTADDDDDDGGSGCGRGGELSLLLHSPSIALVGRRVYCRQISALRNCVCLLAKRASTVVQQQQQHWAPGTESGGGLLSPFCLLREEDNLLLRRSLAVFVCLLMFTQCVFCSCSILAN